MKLPKTIASKLLPILLCLLTNCASIPDVPVFEDLKQSIVIDAETGHTVFAPDPACMAQIGEPACLHGVLIVSQGQLFVGELPVHTYKGKTRSQLLSEMILVPAAESYAPISTWMINTCKKENCNAQVDQFNVKLNSFNGIGPALYNH